MALLFCCRATSCLSAAFFPRSEDAVRFRHAPAGFRSRARPRLRPPRASERRAAASGIGGEAVAPSDAIANAFRQVDADKSGFLTATELKTALEIVKVDQVPTLLELRSIIAEFDGDGDGLLNADEFRKLAIALEEDAQMNTGQNVDGWISSATSTAAVAVSAAESPSLADLERRIQQLLARKGMFSDPSSVYEMQDLLLLRFKHKYVRSGELVLGESSFATEAADAEPSEMRTMERGAVAGDGRSSVGTTSEGRKLERRGMEEQSDERKDGAQRPREEEHHQREGKTDVDADVGADARADAGADVAGGAWGEGVFAGAQGEARRQLLRALRTGDVAAIRASISAGLSWDFVFPPCPKTASGRRVLALEAWCRSPLALLVRPDEGNLRAFMPHVPRVTRLALIREALRARCADPNFPRAYWSTPAAHACFEGDLETLMLLADFGCDLEQRVEWLLQPRPAFSLVHAAAFNGNKNVLEYLRPRVKPETFLSVDAFGSNALHALMSASRDMETASMLVECGVDGFAKNDDNKSPLSMAVETLPQLAEKLLASKSRFEYRWWGKDLYWYSFDGVVFPLDGLTRPLTFASRGGASLSLEQLIAANEAKQLLSVPIVRSLLRRKWRTFGESVYRRRWVQYLGLVASANAILLLPSVDSTGFVLASVVMTVLWYLFLSLETNEIQRNGMRMHFSSFWNLLDAFNLVGIPGLPLLRLLEDQAQLIDQPLISSLVGGGFVEQLGGVLQISMALRALQYASLVRALGPLLVTVGGMVDDVKSLFGVYVVVFVGFANAFLVLFTLSGQPVEYSDILAKQLLWLLNSVELDLFDRLSGDVALAANAIFWAYILISYFVLLNLLIAIFNSTFDKVQKNAFNEWLFLRLETLIEYEAQSENTRGLIAFYEELGRRNNQRSVEPEEGGD